MRVGVLLALALSTLIAGGADAYYDALKTYSKKDFDGAFPAIEREAKKGNREAQYLLGHMYEAGEGVEVNATKAMSWYKKAAAKYQYIVEEEEKELTLDKESLIERIENQMHYTTEQKGAQFAYSKLDVQTPEVKSMIMKFLERNFGLLPYRTNYIAPIAYSSTNYQRHSSILPDDKLPAEWESYKEYDDRLEAEYQLSFQKPFTYNLFGWNEYINFTYTQKVWWKLYDKSGPFRETNYIPELFMLIPTSDEIDAETNLKAVKFGYRHHSNGQEGYASRSWDRLFVAGFWQWGNLFVKTEGWYRFKEKAKADAYYAGIDPKDNGDDNPDILEYMGYGDIVLKYFWERDHVGLMLRNNLRNDNNRGALEVEYSTPFFNSDNTYWYMKFFTGFGESLIDYDRSVNKLNIGFAYSRELF